LRHVAKQPRDGINVSDTHPLVEAGTLVVGLTAMFVLLVLVLIFLIEIALFFIPPEKEAALFRDWLPEDLVTVSPASDQLNETQLLVDRLAFHWADAPYEFRVEIDDSDVANALALPGGLIVVTRGLLEQVQSENELAFVLGHELGHYRNRDHIRGLGRGLVLALFFATVTDGDISGLSLKVTDLALLGFSRRQELAADRFGLELVYTQYGHVAESWRLFERWDEGGDGMAGLAAYASTHPQPGDRIERLLDEAREQDWPVAGDVTELHW
jgi:Zn-dependent protease with chaperone function